MPMVTDLTRSALSWGKDLKTLFGLFGNQQLFESGFRIILTWVTEEFESA